MPVDFNSTPDIDPTKIESDTPLFAPIRTSKKGQKGTFFSDREPEPRTIPTAATRTAPVRAAAIPPATPATGQTLDEPEEVAFAAAPTYAGGRTTVKRNSMLAPMAIVGGLVLLAGVGAAGWYATQQHDSGLAQITPGTSDIAVTPAAPPADQLAQAPSAAPERAPMVTIKRTVTAKAEPAPRPARAAAASRAADDAGVNASAVVPAPARPVTPPVNALPPQAAPMPAPAPVVPPPADTPLPTQTAPTPPQQSPTPPPTEVPPQ